MSCPCTFEPTIQVNCVLELIGLIRSGKLATDRAEALQHVGCIVGSAGAFLAPPVIGGESEASDSIDIPDSLSAQADELHAALTAIQATSDKSINPENLSMILQFLMQLLPILLPLFIKK